MKLPVAYEGPLGVSYVEPYSGSMPDLPLRLRHHEGVAARLAGLTGVDTAENPSGRYRGIGARREYVGYQRLVLEGVRDNSRYVGVYACDQGAACRVADRPRFLASIAEGTAERPAATDTGRLSC